MYYKNGFYHFLRWPVPGVKLNNLRIVNRNQTLSRVEGFKNFISHNWLEKLKPLFRVSYTNILNNLVKQILFKLYFFSPQIQKINMKYFCWLSFWKEDFLKFLLYLPTTTLWHHPDPGGHNLNKQTLIYSTW